MTQLDIAASSATSLHGRSRSGKLLPFPQRFQLTTGGETLEEALRRLQGVSVEMSSWAAEVLSKPAHWSAKVSEVCLRALHISRDLEFDMPTTSQLLREVSRHGKRCRVADVVVAVETLARANVENNFVVFATRILSEGGERGLLVASRLNDSKPWTLDVDFADKKDVWPSEGHVVFLAKAEDC